MLARSFLIKSSGKLQVTRIGVKAQSSSILGRIRPLILELLALEWRKFHTFELEYLWSQLANLDKILCVASLGWGKGCIRFWGRLTLTHWTQVSNRCPLGYLLFQSNFDEMMKRYKQLLTYIKTAVTRNYSEKSINSILDYISTSKQVSLHQDCDHQKLLREICQLCIRLHINIKTSKFTSRLQSPETTRKNPSTLTVDYISTSKQVSLHQDCSHKKLLGEFHQLYPRLYINIKTSKFTSRLQSQETTQRIPSTLS